MSVYTFDNSFVDLIYELNDEEIFNDILLVEGESGSEQLIRGYDSATISKYGRRSKRIERPLADSEATGQDLVEENLDRFIEPVPIISIIVIGSTDELIIQILSLKISDKVTIICDEMGMSQDFVIDAIEIWNEGKSKIICARYELSGLRAGE